MKGIYRRFIKGAGLVVVPPLAYWIIKLVAATIRFRQIDLDRYEPFLREDRRCIFACWHGRLAMMPLAYRKRLLTGLISRHSDGELLARFFKRFGIEAVRGSTTRGSVEGLKALIRSARSGRDIGITPDGPRGPARVAQMGAVQTARLTGLPIVPVSFGASKKKLLRAGTPSYSLIHSPAWSTSTATP